jgi:uncharacterized membrane protein
MGKQRRSFSMERKLQIIQAVFCYYKEFYLSKMKTIRLVGIALMFLGLGLKIADLSGYTPAFIIGALLIISARLHQWYIIHRQNP